jgi:hypothetical protein
MTEIVAILEVASGLHQTMDIACKLDVGYVTTFGKQFGASKACTFERFSEAVLGFRISCQPAAF